MIRFATKLAPGRKKLRVAWECGFRFSELWLSQEILAEGAAQVLRDIPPLPMDFVAHFPNKGRFKKEELDTTVELYRELKCKAMVIHPPMLEAWGESLMERCPEMRLAVENGRQNRKEFEVWADHHQWLTLDVEHVWKHVLSDAPLPKLREVLGDFLASYAEKLIHVHLPGYVPGSAEHHPISRNPSLAGMVWDLLEGCGYEGFVVSETRIKHQTRSIFKRDVALFRNWEGARRVEDGRVAEVGLRVVPGPGSGGLGQRSAG